MRILAVFIFARAFAGPAVAQPVVTAVVNKASYNAVVSPNCLVVIAGYNFAGGVSVTVGGLPAAVLSVSPDEIDALIPPEVTIPPNTVTPLVVTTGSGSVTYNLRLTRNSPGLFINPDTGQALVFDANFNPIDTIAAQDTVILYATGLGPTDSAGQILDDVKVYIGDRKAQVLSAGLAPAMPGIYQVNVTAPSPATDRIYVRSGGWQSNILNIGIRAGMNTANVTGSIDGLYPSNDPGYPKTPPRPCVGDNDLGPCGPVGVYDTLSIMLHAGVFTVSVDIVPGAGPFDIAAIGEAGGTIITVDPATGTYTASVSTLTPAAAHGDFSTSITPLWDFASCSWKSGVCLPFPNNTVPASRIDPYWARAIQMLPVSDTQPVQVSGSLNGSRFTIDAQNNSSLSTFGGVVQIPYGPFDVGVSKFSLYVDGRRIASRDLPYLLDQRAPAGFGAGGF